MSTFDWPRDNAELVSQLARQRDRYEQLVSNMSDLLLLIAPDGTVSYSNRQQAAEGDAPARGPGTDIQSDTPACATLYPPVGTKALDHIVEADRRAFAEAMQDVLDRRATLREVLLRIPDAAGGERIIEGTITPLVEDGKVVHLEFLGRDVTDRHRSAEALREANATLQKQQAELQRDLDVAAKIHASLLPSGFQTDRVLIDLKHIPLLGVGGDYVYIHEQDPLRPAVAVFDVSGHGIASALVANRLHSAVYAIMNQGSPPPEMIERLNRFIYDSFSDLGIFVTLFGIQLDLQGRKLCYCGSGHPPALLRKADTGRTIQLRSAHLPIGVASKVFVDEPMRFAEIASGDVIWLYTDGLTELRDSSGEMLAVEGLTQRFAELDVGEPAEGMAQRCLEAILSGMENPRDDVTLVVVAIK